MPYVLRNAQGVICGAFANLQPGVAEEFLDDANAEFVAWSTTPTPAALFAAVIAAGLAVTSSATPALNGTYAIDGAAQANIGGIAAGIASRNRLPGGGATFDYPDLAGVDRTWTAAQFLNFAAAVEDYVYALSKGQAPSQPVTIA